MYGFEYLQHAQTVRAAAEGMFGGEWENLDLSNDAMSNSGIPYIPNSVARGVVTKEASAAEKTGDAPDFVWNAGIDGTFRMMGLEAYASGGSDADSIVINETDGEIKMEKVFSGLDNDSDADMPFINLSEDKVEEDEVIELWYISQRWCYFGKPGEADVPLRCKFSLQEGFLRNEPMDSGYALATVIDPMNSKQQYGATITVWDYKKEFCTAPYGAIGVAIFQNPFAGEKKWHTEWCENLIDTISATLVNSLTPWAANDEDPGNDGPIVVQAISPTSQWPHIHWNGPDEYTGGEISGVHNIQNFVANAQDNSSQSFPDVWLKRTIPNTHLPDPTNTTAPYTLPPLGSSWEITAIKTPTAPWATTEWDGAMWKLTAENYWDGANPLDHDFINEDDQADPPPAIWSEITGLDLECHIPVNTKGIAKLDIATGKFLTLGTASGLFGTPTVVDFVGKIDANQDERLIVPVDGECGLFEYEKVKKALVWGNEGTNETGCKLEQDGELDRVDIFEDAVDIDVLVGLDLDPNGDVTRRYKTIKACDPEEYQDTLSLPTVDVVNDVYCSGDTFSKDYKTIKYFGGEVNSSSGVAIDTSCIEIDYTQIIYPDYPYIDYYDIIWPGDCEPCDEPSGCCVITAVGGKEQYENKSANWCESQYNNREDVYEWDWNTGPCQGCCYMFFRDSSGSTVENTSQEVCVSRDNSGYIDPATGEAIDDTFWQQECSPFGCCSGGSKDGWSIGQSECISAGGSWTEGPCPTGCCVEPGTPVHNKVVTKKACDEYNGTWNQGQTCSGDSLGCCVVYDQQGRILNQDSNLTMSECEQFFLNTPGAYSKNLNPSQPNCPPAIGCCNGGTYDNQQVYEGQCVAGGGSFQLGQSCDNSGGSCEDICIESMYIDASGGNCSATFTQDDEACFDSIGRATVEGTWEINSFSTSGTITRNGTVLVTKTGNTYNISCDINGGPNVDLSGSGPATEDCEGGTSGNVSGSCSDGSDCVGSWNGYFTFSTTA